MGEDARELVSRYTDLLLAVVKGKPDLQPCLKHCLECGIIFPTHFRNAGRHDLCCPFGCRQERRKKRSSQRSLAYYQDEKGRKLQAMKNNKYRQKKELGTGKRSETKASLVSAAPISASEYDEKMVEHVRMATSIFEGRKVSRQEVLEMLAAEKKRQHSIGEGEKVDYGVRDLNENTS